MHVALLAFTNCGVKEGMFLLQGVVVLNGEIVFKAIFAERVRRLWWESCTACPKGPAVGLDINKGEQT